MARQAWQFANNADAPVMPRAAKVARPLMQPSAIRTMSSAIQFFPNPVSFMPTLMPTLRTASLLTILLLPALAACGRQSQSQPQASPPPPPQVKIAKPVSKMVVDQDEYVGRFVAVESVEVRARVPGYLEAIHFQDGQMVKEGDLLFTIDRRPFQIALAQAQASFAQAKATLAFAESDLARAQGLAIGTVITQQTFDQRTQAKRSAEASVASQQAAERQETPACSPQSSQLTPSASSSPWMKPPTCATGTSRRRPTAG